MCAPQHTTAHSRARPSPPRVSPRRASTGVCFIGEGLWMQRLRPAVRTWVGEARNSPHHGECNGLKHTTLELLEYDT